MKEFSLLRSIPLSLFSSDLYRDVGKNWKGLGFSYLLVVLAICWIFTAFNFSYNLNKIDNDSSTQETFDFIAEILSPNKPFSTEEQLNRILKISSQFPDVIIENGAAEILTPTPYIIKDPQTDTPIVIFDNTGSYTSLENSDALMLVTESKIVIGGEDEERSYYISEWDTEDQESADLFFVLMSQIPEVKIEKGKASTNVSEPYFIEAYGSNVGIIDTTGKYNSVEDDSTVLFLLTKESLIYKSDLEHNDYTIESFPLSEINRKNALHGLGYLLNFTKTYMMWAIVILTPFAILFSFVFYIFISLICGIIGLLFALIVGCKLEYVDIVRLTSVCLTPSLIVQTFSTNSLLSGNIFAVSGWLLFLITVVYLFFAVRANKTSKETISS